jgi:hemoglobin/transferrin/lactoferrin receptor protein
VGEGWKLSGGLGYSKGKLSNETSLLSIQPLKAIIGLDYEQPEGRWGVFSRMTYRGEKKPGDAKVTEISGSRGNLVQNVVTYPWLNSSATVFDVYGYYKPLKTLTLRAGVYNLFDRKYHTWDSLRGINANSTTNSVDRAGKGLARFYAPGRNFALALEYKF